LLIYRNKAFNMWQFLWSLACLWYLAFLVTLLYFFIPGAQPFSCLVQDCIALVAMTEFIVATFWSAAETGFGAFILEGLWASWTMACALWAGVAWHVENAGDVSWGLTLFLISAFIWAIIWTARIGKLIPSEYRPVSHGRNQDAEVPVEL
jgi:hypothetical protein